MSTVALDQVVEIPRLFRLQWEESQQAYVLLYPEGMVKLSQSAGEILKRVDGKTSVEDIISNLETAFPGADLKPDVLEFMEEAHAKGWIRAKSA
jgi:pyrroloquinoline quinone biosynthesis protein D